MQIEWGQDAGAAKRGEDRRVVWDSRNVVNPHMLIVGMSGAGKTHWLRNVVRAAVANKTPDFRAHVFDVHGDIEVEGASTVMFSESTDYGINPLIVDPDRHAGGVRKRVQGLIGAINRTSVQLGSKQEAVLRNLLTDLYAANGFYIDKPDSWQLHDGAQRRYPKKYPTLQDAQRFAGYKLKAMYLGTDEKGVQALEEVNKLSHRVFVKNSALRKHDSSDREGAEKKDAELEKAIDAARAAYDRYLNEIRSGKELDNAIRYTSRDVLQSVVERIGNLNGIGIFKPTPPPFDPNAAVHRYHIKSLGRDEQKLYTHFTLEQILRSAMNRGETKGVRDLIVLDEASLHLDESEDNICNRIALEGRKFGVALVCASQAPTHFPEDFLSSVATKVVLGIDEMFWDSSIRKMRLTAEALKFVLARKRAVVQIKQESGGRSDYSWVYLPGSYRNVP